MPNVFGTNGDDVIKASASNDMIRTFGGHDKILTGAGVDFVDAGNGNDLLVINTGAKLLVGGSGSDEFRFKEDSSGVVVISDFEDGKDTINLIDLGITDIKELDIQTTSLGTVIQIAEITIVLNVDMSTLSNEDFLLAQPPAKSPLNFENLSIDIGHIEEIRPDYAGYTWKKFFLMETDEYGQVFPDSGYVPNRGTNVIFNGFEDPATIKNSAVFDLESAYMSAAWNNQLEVTVKGWLDGTVVGTQTFTLNKGDLKKILFDDDIFDQVDKVKFSATGGRDADGADEGTGMNFSIDDLLLL